MYQDTTSQRSKLTLNRVRNSPAPQDTPRPFRVREYTPFDHAWMNTGDPSRSSPECVLTHNQMAWIHSLLAKRHWVWKGFHALEVGIHKTFAQYVRTKIIPDMPEQLRDVSNRTINRVLKKHCQNQRYLENLGRGSKRYNLDGSQVGITEGNAVAKRVGSYREYWKRHPTKERLMREARRAMRSQQRQDSQPTRRAKVVIRGSRGLVDGNNAGYAGHTGNTPVESLFGSTRKG